MSTTVNLRAGASGAKQHAQQERIAFILDVISIHIHPPASTEITGIAWAKFGCVVYQFLEPSVHRQAIRAEKVS